ncbi:uncharacterized protein SCHCODRAFT_02669239 [Schizophyllum commune H4-8]|nr:uncharacterized protein SCHCODRAFT_02669239 [Schizophyllum commune H4-8]KAI5890031.1 hypothetical protein SCHCODRAFT_02669239 [Schizophyllum commune H4-8]
MASSNASSSTVPRTSPRFMLADGTVRFQLDDGTLYCVHRHFFQQHSPTFAAQYLSGSQDEVVPLHDVSGVDFDHFLSLFYPTRVGKCDVQSAEEWGSILRLASRWSFPDLRELAIQELETIASPVEKIALARECHVPQWPLDAYANVCTRTRCLSVDEAEALGSVAAHAVRGIRAEIENATELSARLMVEDLVIRAGLVLAQQVEEQDTTRFTRVSGQATYTPYAGDAGYARKRVAKGNCTRTSDHGSFFPLMADLTRPHSVQSFASNESIPSGLSSWMTTASPSTVSDSPASTRFYLSDGNIKFKLDDSSVYNVHRSFFETHSPKFAAKYLCNSHAEVVRLPGVSCTDFERFLSLMYPAAIGEYDIETVAEWSSVLRLATKWSFNRLRALAMREIEPLADAVDKIVLAREFDLGDAWIVPALKEICAAPDWLEYEDAQRLGLRTVVEIGRAREKLRGTTLSPLSRSTKVPASVSATSQPPFAHEANESLGEPSPTSSPRLASLLGPFDCLWADNTSAHQNSFPVMSESPGPYAQDPNTAETKGDSGKSTTTAPLRGYACPANVECVAAVADPSVAKPADVTRKLPVKKGKSGGKLMKDSRFYLEIRSLKPKFYAIIDHAPVRKRTRSPDKGPPSVQSFASNESISLPPSMASTAPTMIPSPGNPRFNLSDGNIKFKLDDGNVYNVHRSFFEAHSPQFAAEYLCNSHAEVVRLPEISSVDFECFLSMIYPTAIGEFDVQTVAEWSSVLRLATRWSFDRLRTLALREVGAIATAVDKIVLAREFGFGDAWIEPALKTLCAAPGWLEYEEAERLGLRTVFEIGRAREKLRKAAVSIPDKLAVKKGGSVNTKTRVAATSSPIAVPSFPPAPSSSTSEHPVPPCPCPTSPITPKECAGSSTKPLSKSTWGRWGGNISEQSPTGWGISPMVVSPTKSEEAPEKPKVEVQKA